MASLKKLFQIALDTTDTTLCVCPASVTWTVTRLYICNASGTAGTFRLHHVAAGAVAATGNALYYEHPLAANRTVCDGGLVLEPGQKLIALRTTATAVTVTGFGVETAV